jgi:hypothetical protein
MAGRQNLDDIIRDAIMRSKNSERKFAELPAKVRIKRRMQQRGLLSNPYDYWGKPTMGEFANSPRRRRPLDKYESKTLPKKKKTR